MYLRNRLYDIQNRPEYKLLKVTDQAVFTYIWVRLRTKDAQYTIRKQTFDVPQGAFAISTRTLSEKTGFSHKVIRNAIKRLEQFEILQFNKLERHEKNYGFLVTIHKKTGPPNKHQIEAKKALQCSKTGTPNQKTGTPNKEKRARQNSVKLIKFVREDVKKECKKEEVVKKRARQITKNGHTHINTSEYINKNESLLISSTKYKKELLMESNQDVDFLIYKDLKMSIKDIQKEYYDLLKKYYDNARIKAPKANYENAVRLIDTAFCYQHGLKKLCLFIGWTNSVDAENNFKVRFWPQWEALLKKPDDLDRIKFGYRRLKDKYDAIQRKNQYQNYQAPKINKEEEEKTLKLKNKWKDLQNNNPSEAENIRNKAIKDVKRMAGIYSSKFIGLEAGKGPKFQEGLINGFIMEAMEKGNYDNIQKKRKIS